MNDLEKEQNRARADLEAASKRLDEAGGSVVQSEIRYDLEESDEAFAALEVALSSQRRGQLDLTRAERKLVEAEEAFRQAIIGERRTELEGLKHALTPDERRAAYDHMLAAIIPLVLQLDELVEKLGGANVELIVKHDRARELAKYVGDIGFTAQVPRPMPDEAVSLLRLLVAEHTAGAAHAAITPWDRPASWTDAGMPIYEAAKLLLEGSERFS